MYTISNTTKNNLERSLGISLKMFSSMTADEESKWISKKIGKPVVFSKRKRHGRVGRGNPLLSRRKLRTQEDLAKKSRDLFGV